MDAPLPGHLYFDPGLHNGHYFIVGPEDPLRSSCVLVFCCTSQRHGRPDSHGCHASYELPAFHIQTGTVANLPKPTWVQLDECYYYEKDRFKSGSWAYAREKLELSLTVDLLDCAAQSNELARADIAACKAEAESLQNAL